MQPNQLPAPPVANSKSGAPHAARTRSSNPPVEAVEKLLETDISDDPQAWGQLLRSASDDAKAGGEGLVRTIAAIGRYNEARKAQRAEAARLEDQQHSRHGSRHERQTQPRTVT